jgi:hypothetical protein
MRHILTGGLNFFIVFNHYERLKVQSRDDPMENLIVPSRETVTQGGIWVVDFFPPSHYSALVEALQRNGWDKQDIYSIKGSNAERVTNARRGKGFAWSRIGLVVNRDSNYSVPDAKREKLPKEFSSLEIKAVQLGQSLTAVVASVNLSQQGQLALHRVWTSEHEPIFEWRGLRRPHAEGRYFAAVRTTQRERQRLHDLARAWLAQRCGGYFAHTKARQPVVDFNLFSEFDPLSEPATRGISDTLRALGMEGNYPYNYVSPQIPGTVFIPGAALRSESEALQNCWAVVGAYDVVTQLNDSPGYGEKPYSISTLARMFDDEIQSFLLYTAVIQYASQLRETLSDARDMARIKHRQFKPRQVDHLRNELLITSFDLPVVARDSAFLWDSRWRRWNGIDVTAVPAPGVSDPPDGFDLIDDLGDVRSRAFAELIDEDVAYRDVLSTVSALGASAAEARLGRRALLIACASLLVAVVTLLVASGEPSVWEQFLGWVRR